MRHRIVIFSRTGALLAAPAWPSCSWPSALLPASAQDGSGGANRDALYQGGMSNLRVLSRYFTPAQSSRMPTLQAILHRVVYETDQASDDELAIGTALVTGQPVSLGGGKGPGMGQAILALHFKPLVAVHAAPAQVAAVVKPVAQPSIRAMSASPGRGKP